VTAPIDHTCDCPRCATPRAVGIGPLLAIALLVVALSTLVVWLIATGPGTPPPAVAPSTVSTPVSHGGERRG
jgi:hypothetical protein